MNSNGDKTILDFLTRHWAIIIFLGALIVGWTNFSAKLDTTESRLTKLRFKTK
jgi:hypothetical protein